MTLAADLASRPHSGHLHALSSLLSSAWHGMWQLATTSPWVAIALMVPAIAVLVGCTRMSVRS